MIVTQTPYTIAEYCQALLRSEIKVNQEYQRSPKVWPVAARSFLIETILLGYPMPKFALYQITDLKSRTTIKEIVDGQQRSNTIMEFYRDELRLARSAGAEEIEGRTYSQLGEEWQHKFLSYSLSVDLFVGATKEDIREVFRRVNSYQAPLNAEERRHAGFQGRFKWFIYHLSRRFAEAFGRIGTFTEMQLARMRDAKLLSEVTHAILHGITTTRDGDLTKLYERNDAAFPQAEDVDERLSSAMNVVLGLQQCHRGALVKHYQIYSLLLAIMHADSPVATLRPHYSFGRRRVDPLRATEALSRLAAAVQDEGSEPKLAPFVKASSEKTNVADHRVGRFQWFCRALEDKLP